MRGIVSAVTSKLVLVVVAALVLATMVAGVARGSSGDTGDNRDGSRVCGLDKYWLQTSVEGDIFEIRGGHIALDKSHKSQVRRLARTLIKDHTESLQETRALAHRLGVEVPDEPSPTEQWQLEEISEIRGSEFNHDYSELEVADHIQDISDAMDEAEMGCNHQVRELARQDIPMLKMHLHLAHQALAASGSEHHKH